MGKLAAVAAGAAGYVLGARAGRSRYEEIVEQAKQLRNNPTVQRATEQAGTKASALRQKASRSGGSADESPDQSATAESTVTAKPAGAGKHTESKDSPATNGGVTTPTPTPTVTPSPTVRRKPTGDGTA